MYSPQMGTQADRNARLDQLVTDVQSWSKQRQLELNNRVTQLTNMLQARGAGQLLNATATAATVLVQNEIDNFVNGGS